MNRLEGQRRIAWLLIAAAAVFPCASCCCLCSGSNGSRLSYRPPPGMAPLGALSDAAWSDQVTRAQASKVVIYDHEFKLRSARMNSAGEDHVKQIAARLIADAPFPVIVERSMNDNSAGQYHYPSNPNPELDNQRRQVVVAALRQMGIENADQRVVVAPALATPATSQESQSAYLQGLSTGRSNGTFGGGFGGFGGFGGGGGGFFNLPTSDIPTNEP